MMTQRKPRCAAGRRAGASFVLGSLVSGLPLYDISLVYGFSGTMEFGGRIAQVLSDPAHGSPGLIVGLVFVVARPRLQGLRRAVPHVDAGCLRRRATPVTAFLATAPKVAAVALLVRVMATPFGHLLVQWQQVIILVSILSMLLGSLAAIGQNDIKRLMAYSSIGHMGLR